MPTAMVFTPKIKKGLVHLTVLLIISLMILKIISNSFGPTLGKNYLWYDLGPFLLVVVIFYLHSLLFLPILLKQKKIKIYLLWTLICFLVFGFGVSWIEALYSSKITSFSEGGNPSPKDFFLQKKWILDTFLLLLLCYVPFVAISFLYHVLLSNKEERKELFSLKYIELYVNALILIPILIVVFLNTVSHGNYLIFFEVILFALFFYLNVFSFIPVFFKERNIGRYLLFIFLSFISIFVGTTGIFEISFLDSTSNLTSVSTFFIIVFSMSLIYGYIRIKIKAKEQLFNLKMGAKESELSLLKSQVNPHFLFNVLNTLYSTALKEKADKTAESTAKLANLLRYMQNDINKDFIPLENEIQYLKDYIAIQRLRYEIPPEVETTFKNVDKKTISPGLLIPFVENAFKHGLNRSKTSRLSLAVICDETSIYFECTNSYDSGYNANKEEQGFGIGIKNTRERLELVYPKNHTLAIAKIDNNFTVKLSITSRTK